MLPALSAVRRTTIAALVPHLTQQRRAFARDNDSRTGGVEDHAMCLGCMVYHPVQSQGHIKAVTMARAIQNAIHNQRFCLSVISESCGLRGPGDIAAICRDQFQPRRPVYHRTTLKAFPPFALQG
jgi:hypothetical protein